MAETQFTNAFTNCKIRTESQAHGCADMQSGRQQRTEHRSPREMINLTVISLSSDCSETLSWKQICYRWHILPLCKKYFKGALILLSYFWVKFQYIYQVLVSSCVEKNDDWNAILFEQINMCRYSTNSIIWEDIFCDPLCIRLHRMHNTWTIAADDPVAKVSVSQSVSHVGDCIFYSFARWHHFNAAITTLL